MPISEEEKRWMVVGLTLIKVLAPKLRKCVKNAFWGYFGKLQRKYDLKNPRRMTYHGDLYFNNINNNYRNHGDDWSKYSYTIRDYVDLAKLYLPHTMVHFRTFDDSVDMSALLLLLGNDSTSTIFRSGQTEADNVRKFVRNKWGHCNLKEWTQACYDHCFEHMQNLGQSLGLASAEANQLGNELTEWQLYGWAKCTMGHLDKELMAFIKQSEKDFPDLQNKVDKVMKKLKQVKEKQEEHEQKVEERMEEHEQKVEGRIDEHEQKVEGWMEEHEQKVEERMEEHEQKVEGRIEEHEQKVEGCEQEIHGLEQKFEKFKQTRELTNIAVAAEYKKFVIGSQECTIKHIRAKSGASVEVSDEGFRVSGSEAERKDAEERILEIVGDRKRVYSFIDHSGLPDNCRLKLKEVAPGEYRLKPHDDCTKKGDENTNDEEPRYLGELSKMIYLCLREIEKHTPSGERNDVLCHFGTMVIENVDKDEVDKEWTLDEVTAKLARTPNGQPQWRIRFKDLPNFELGSQLITFLKSAPDTGRPQDTTYDTRHDLTFLTPSRREVRFKVWIGKEGVKPGDNPPLDDVQNILETLRFTEKQTAKRCKGWLCLSSVTRLRADIMFPAYDVDFRVTIRKNDQYAEEGTDIERKEYQTLAKYLNNVTVEEGTLWLPNQDEMPRGFRKTYWRHCERKIFTPDTDFTYIISDERTFCVGGQDVAEKKQDIHLQCNDWDEWLRKGKWEAPQIVDKLREFLRAMMKAHSVIMQGRR